MWSLSGNEMKGAVPAAIDLPASKAQRLEKVQNLFRPDSLWEHRRVHFTTHHFTGRMDQGAGQSSNHRMLVTLNIDLHRAWKRHLFCQDQVISRSDRHDLPPPTMFSFRNEARSADYLACVQPCLPCLLAQRLPKAACVGYAIQFQIVS